MYRLLFTVALLCGFHPLAQAHDPGISRGVVHWQDTGMMIELRFNRSDIEPLLARVSDRDGLFADKTIAAKGGGLHNLIAKGIEVRKARKTIAPTSIHVEPGSDEMIRVALRYALAHASAVEIRIPLLAQLARGHRMHLTVRNRPEGQPVRYLIDRTHSPIEL